ncbi:MAG: protein arginine kinase [Acutalibacteraceae bacterium]
MTNDVVISTRIRLARNLKEFPFPRKLNCDGREKVIEKVTKAIKDSNSSVANEFKLIRLSDLSKEQAVSLVERHLVSPEFISESDGRALLILPDESVSIMINEEDHIRLQVFTKGLSLTEAYDTADKLDTLLDESLDFAFDERLGYLTQCPTNLGTGMRASVMLHLPALQKAGTISRIAGNLSKLGLTIRGSYGEGTEPKGAMYQLSNQVTLGISEQSAMENLRSITTQLVNQEISAREKYLQSIDMQDTISRSLGILKYAKSISHEEAMQLLSNVRLGVSSGLLSCITAEKIDKLITDIQPAEIMVSSGEKLTPAQRDIKRAQIIQSAIA